MSRKVIQAYLDEIEQLLLNCSNTYIEEYSAVVLITERANLRIRIRLALKYLLAVSEAFVIVDNQITYIDYRYHFQDEQNSLIFRYDSTPHFPKLPSFPHHKHLFDNVIACEKPHIADVLQEVMEFLESKQNNLNVTIKILLIDTFLLTANHCDRINFYQHIFR
ncbi:toxin TumE [Nostoc sp.]|uniref:toxin TumE n=1 Tax=Nostoc sp. TaxID=1180 RepID=UPI002FFBD9A8